ncbi:MAG: TonB-dependent receptor domain-containing protein, partial [Gemmatimonadales bacterium]
MTYLGNMRPAGRLLVAYLALIATLSASGLTAQETTGRLDGTVTDPTGGLLGGAEVSVAGTALRATTDLNGRFTIRFVPPGVRTVEIRAPGYEQLSHEVRVWAGEVVRVEVQGGRPAAPPAQGVPPVVHRDALTSRGALTGAFLSTAPIDDARQALHLVPGVFTRGAAVGFGGALGVAGRSAQGGPAAAYIDGAPVRLGLFGGQELALAVGMIEQVSVTTGAASPLAPDAHRGVVSFVTPIGGDRVRARFRSDTDEPFGERGTVGYNRLEGFAGGPVPRVPNLRWLVAASGQGQRSQYRGWGAEDVPTYVLGGRDTTVLEMDPSGSAVAVEVPRFVQFSGECGTIGSAGSTAGRDIAQNYGFECQGLRRPMDWSSSLRALGKLSYSFGGASSVSLTALATGEQRRAFPGPLIGAPSLYLGAHTSSRLLALTAHHRLSLGGMPLAVRVHLSRGADRAVAGPLETLSDLDTRAPALGIQLGTLRFTGAGLIPFPLTDELLRNIRTNSGLRVPYLDRTDLRRGQAGRMNPYALRNQGWFTQGLDGQLTMLSEVRVEARADAEWEPHRHHRVTVGADIGRTDLSFYTSGLLSQSFMDAFVAHPRRLGIVALDRMGLGDLVLELGARFERLDVGSIFPRVPFRIFTHPRYNQLYVLAPTDDQVYRAFLSDTAIWVPSRAHSALSPSVRAAYSFDRNTVVRFAYSRRLEAPTYGEWLTGSNSDLSFTNTNTPVGRDVDLRTSGLIEAGLRFGLGDWLALDVT